VWTDFQFESCQRHGPIGGAEGRLPLPSAMRSLTEKFMRSVWPFRHRLIDRAKINRNRSVGGGGRRALAAPNVLRLSSKGVQNSWQTRPGHFWRVWAGTQDVELALNVGATMTWTAAAAPHQLILSGK